MKTSNRRPEVMFVDDDPVVLRHIENEMQRYHKHWNMTFVASTEEAIRVLENQHIDVLFTDLHIPTPQGAHMLTTFTRRYFHMPVVIMTNQTSVDAVVECMKTGAYDYLTKPIAPQSLRRIAASAVKASMRGHQFNPPVTIHSDRRMLGEFETLRRLGSGNMGVVYLARKITDRDTLCALKILKLEDETECQHRAESIERFRREAEIASTIHHPNIVRVFEHGIVKETTDVPYMMMEYFRSESLREVMLRKTHLTLDSKVRIIRQVAEALDAIHQHGLCHRDIKPHNILVNEHHHTKLTDFGIALMPNSTLTQHLIGTPCYLPPESFVSSKVDIRADLYSLGVTAYELLLGRLPFRATPLPALVRTIIEDNPLITEIDSSVPDELSDIVIKLLKKRPDERYPEPRALIGALDAFLEGIGAPTRPYVLPSEPAPEAILIAS